MGDVDGVVDAGADADDVADGQVGVNGHPQSGVAEPHHVHQGEQDAAEDEDTGRIGGWQFNAKCLWVDFPVLKHQWSYD